SVSEHCEHYTPFLVQAGCRNVTRQVLCIDGRLFQWKVGVTTLRARYSFSRLGWVSKHHMTGVMTLMADCFIGGFGVGVDTSEAFHRLLGLD
ncbi:hypothetical protein Golax_022713, partial [Gossypium laxum]|nr:hypothetical protein [Gossypium laxum]